VEITAATRPARERKAAMGETLAVRPSEKMVVAIRVEPARTGNGGGIVPMVDHVALIADQAPVRWAIAIPRSASNPRGQTDISVLHSGGGVGVGVTGYTRRHAVLLSAGLGPAITLAGADVGPAGHKPGNPDAALRQILGVMPSKPAPSFSILETVAVEGGKRLKIEYLAEPASALLHEPEDRIRAYLFIPDHASGARLPAILALHQDGPNTHIGKKETAGLEGDANLFYGLELFRRGHVVLCADRFYHAERRRGAAPDSVNPARDLDLLNHRVGQLVLHGRTAMGKEAHDCMVGVDVLASLPHVDPARIGAIGHSAGGYAMVFAMFLDRRIRAGVSSCGYFDPVRFFDEKAPKRRLAADALPGLARFGSGAGYLAGVAPRPLLLTRGLWEWGRDRDWRQASIDHVEETRRLVADAAPRYRARGAPDALRALYFDENGGNHDFPPGVRRDAYAWLETQLQMNRGQVSSHQFER
jgi:dienelactone hydrolase